MTGTPFDDMFNRRNGMQNTIHHIVYTFASVTRYYGLLSNILLSDNYIIVYLLSCVYVSQ